MLISHVPEQLFLKYADCCRPKQLNEPRSHEQGHRKSLYSSFVDSFHEEKKERRRIVVLVDDAEVARTALGWAMVNVVCSGDIITLLHVYPASSSSSSVGRQWIAISQSKRPILSRMASSSSRRPSTKATDCKVRDREARLRRLKGFQMALSLSDVCDMNNEAKVEIVVVEGEREPTVLSFARKLGASALILGHQKRCLFSRVLGIQNASSDYFIENSDCLVLAVEHTPSKKEISWYRNTTTVSKVRVVRYV